MKTFTAVSAAVFALFVTSSALACDLNEIKSLQALYQTPNVFSLGVSTEIGRYKIIPRDGRILYVETDRSSSGGIPTIKRQFVLSNQ